MLVRGGGPVARTLVARELNTHLPFLQSRESYPTRLVHHRDGATSTSNRLVSGDIFHLESLKISQNVSSLVTWYEEELLEKSLSTYCVKPAGKYFGISPR